MSIANPARRAKHVRARVLIALTLAGFAVVTLGLLLLQVVDHPRYLELSKENRVRLEVLRAPRGAIRDRNGELLADSAPSFSIVFRPFPAESAQRARLTRRPEWLRRVAGLVGLDTTEVRARVTAANRSGQTAMLRRDAPFAVRAGAEEMRSELPGIEVQVEPLRHYPHGALAAHLLGYAGQINEDELDDREDQGYRPGDLIGRTGVESQYEDELRGTDGAEFVVVNANGRRVAGLPGEPPQPPHRGHDLVLTIDLGIQKALEEGMAGVERGAAVAIDPRDGGILALVSRPSFDPNEFSHGISQERWTAMNAGNAYPLLDRAIQGVYPPGSTFKAISMTAALKAGVATRDTRLQPCLGGYNFGGRWFGCWNRRGHGVLDFIGALEHSCDVYFYQIGLRLGLAPLSDTARDFGLGMRTGVDLPHENRGFVPTPAWYDGHARGGKGLLLNLAIGQGELLVTPLQLAVLMAEIANDGRAVRPHLVKAIRGVPQFQTEHPAQSGVTADPEVWAAVQEGLERVVSTGTGTAARVPGVRVAGKTGTAQNPHGKDHALFACYAPVEHPEIAMAVVIENIGHGGTYAAPAAGLVLRRLFHADTTRAGRLAPARPDTSGADVED